jgi:phosphoglycerate dehydrogenase-like enzyme
MKTKLLNTVIQFLVGLTKSIWGTAEYKILIHDPVRQRSAELQRKIAIAFPFSSIQTICSVSKFSFLAHIRQADFAYSYGLSKFAKPENLKLLYIGQVGKPPIPIPENCKVLNAPNFASDLIADYVIASIFAYERGLLLNNALQNKQKWHPEAYLSRTIKRISDRKIGIIGIGRIGNQIAYRLQKNDIEIHVFDKDVSKTKGFMHAYHDTNWHEMLQYVDYLVLALSGEGNIDLISSRVLSNSNPNLCIVNISRGDVINEKDLLHALKIKQIRGAILDVFQKEPLPKRHPFWKQEGVVITPHIAGNINLVFNDIADDFIGQLRTFINGDI